MKAVGRAELSKEKNSGELGPGGRYHTILPFTHSIAPYSANKEAAKGESAQDSIVQAERELKNVYERA